MLVAHRVSGGSVAGAARATSGSLLLNIEGEGVALCSTSDQTTNRAWGLGDSDRHFTAPSAYESSSKTVWAALEASDKSSLHAWRATSEARDVPANGIALASRPTHLIPGASTRDGPHVWVLADHGGVSYCSETAVLASAVGSGTPLVARPFQDGASIQVVSASAATPGEVRSSQFHFLVDTVEEAADWRLRAPADASHCQALGATCSESLVTVLWSDGSLASYSWSARGKGSDVDHINSVSVVRLANVAAPNEAEKKTGRKRRSKSLSGPDAVRHAQHAALCFLPELEVTVAAYWATSSSSGSTALRLTAVQRRYGAVLCCEDLGEAHGLSPQALVAPGAQVQLLPLGSSSVAISVSGAGCCVAHINTEAGESLAGLIGSLSLIASNEGRSPSSSVEGQSLSPLALAARRALAKEKDVDTNQEPKARKKENQSENLKANRSLFSGDVLRPVYYTFTSDSSNLHATELATPCSLGFWEECDAGEDAGRKREETERSGWTLVANLEKKTMNEPDSVEALQPLLRLKGPIPSGLHSSLLSAAAARGYFGLAGALLEAQPPASLSGAHAASCCADLAEAGRYRLVALALRGGCAVDLDPAALGRITDAVLRPRDAQGALEICKRYRAQAEAALTVAERDVVHQQAKSNLSLSYSQPASIAAAQLAVAAVEAFEPSQMPTHALLATTFDRSQLEAGLRTLGPRALPALLEALRRWVRVLASLPAQAQPVLQSLIATTSATTPQLPYPSLVNVTAWLTALLDAGLTRLALTPGAEDKLRGLARDVERAAAQAAAWSRVRGGVESLLVQAPMPGQAKGKQEIPIHSVELIDLSVVG